MHLYMYINDTRRFIKLKNRLREAWVTYLRNNKIFLGMQNVRKKKNLGSKIDYNHMKKWICLGYQTVFMR